MSSPANQADQTRWTAVDDYLNRILIQPDPTLEATMAANAAAGLPAIDLSPNQAKFLYMLALVQGAKRILEVGTLGAYSTIWLARALPADGCLITLELSPQHAKVALSNISRAGLANVVHLRLGPAALSLAQLHAEAEAPFDLIFIDADKANNPIYLEWAIKLSRPGTIVVIDNVIRDGEVANPDSLDPQILGTRTMFEILSTNPNLTAAALQTVGSKGYDGFAIALVSTNPS